MARRNDSLKPYERAFHVFIDRFGPYKKRDFNPPWGRDEFFSFMEQNKYDPVKVEEWVDAAVKEACDGKSIKQYRLAWLKRNGKTADNS